jgi:hypothetical protein
VEAIAPSPLGITGPAAFTLASGPIPASLALDPGASDTLTWRLVAAAVGETRFVGSAEGTGTPSGLVRRAPATASPIHRAFTVASRLDLDAVQTMPITVNPGQAGIVPFSLTLTNPGGPAVSDVRLRGLHVRLETEAGGPVVPTELIARVLVHEGTNEYLARTTLESAGNDLDLTLATPVRITGSEPVTLSLIFDLSPTTVVPTFRVVVPDSASFAAEDATSLAPVTVGLRSGGYPLRSTVARVLAPATDVDLSAAAADTLRLGRGTPAVSLLQAAFLNRGVASVTADARVSAFRVEIHDGADQPVPAGARLSALRVVQSGRVLSNVVVGPASGSAIDLVLSPPLNLPAGSPMDVSVEGDLAPDATVGSFRLALVDSGRVNAYDANSRLPLAVHFERDPLPGRWCRIEAAAETLLIAHTPTMPATLLIGETGIAVLSAGLRHPDPPGTARIRLDSLTVSLRDELRRPLVASTYIDRARVTRGGFDIAVITSLPAASAFGVPLGGFLMEPGDSTAIGLAIDVNPTAPTGNIELVIPGSGVHAADANTSRSLAVLAEPGFELPVVSGLGQVASPSRELVVGLTSRMPAVLAADGREIVAGELTLSNRDPEGVGDIVLDRLRLRAADAEYRARTLGAVVERVEAWVNGGRWAASGTLAPDSSIALLLATQPLAIPKGTPVVVDLRWVPRTGTAEGRIRLGLERADVGVVQPTSALLAVQVLPENGQSFPMWSEAGGFGATEVAASYSNFPNPFAAGREATRFTYYLPGDGRVWLRIRTARGGTVATLADGTRRGSGQHQDDAWDGRNGHGHVVLNGVYVAELVVRFDDGTVARCLRKVAVVR